MIEPQDWLVGVIFLGILLAGIIFLTGDNLKSAVKQSLSSPEKITENSRQIYRLPSFLSRIFPETITPEGIKQKYQRQTINILLVPGHDKAYGGALFKNLVEADLNIQVASELYNLLNADPSFKIETTRNLSNGFYTTKFNNYFNQEKDNILSFMDERKGLMRNLLDAGDVDRNVTIKHNFAPGDTAIRLYGINKWANENNIDLSLHLHFNDYPGHGRRVGKYSGFTIYTPEEQFSNARTSRDIASALYDNFTKYFPVSNFPKEINGIVESQQLIALGSNASQKGAALLLENGYIYEARFATQKIRERTIKEIALQTYNGIKKYFDPSYKADGFGTSLLPHTFNRALKNGERSSIDVLALQAALHDQGLYPPNDKTMNECPINGNFGPCTEKAVISFQNKYKKDVLTPAGYSSGTAIVGFYTLKLLNQLYSF